VVIGRRVLPLRYPRVQPKLKKPFEENPEKPFLLKSLRKLGFQMEPKEWPERI